MKIRLRNRTEYIYSPHKMKKIPSKINAMRKRNNLQKKKLFHIYSYIFLTFPGYCVNRSISNIRLDAKD